MQSIRHRLILPNVPFHVWFFNGRTPANPYGAPCVRTLAHVLRRPSYVWPRSSDAKLRCSYLLEITELMRAAEWNPVGPGTSLCCPRERDATEETLTGGREKRRRQLGARRASHCNSSILSLKSKNISIHEAAER